MGTQTFLSLIIHSPVSAQKSTGPTADTSSFPNKKVANARGGDTNIFFQIVEIIFVIKINQS